MVYKILWSKPSIDDLEAIGAYIAKDDPEAAVRVGRMLLDHVQVLTIFPYIGTPFPRYGHSRVREILCLNYRIFYRIQGKAQRVEILRVWHGSRSEPKNKEVEG